MRQAITAARVFDGDRMLSSHAVVLAGDRIESLLPRAGLDPALSCLDLGNVTLAPGFLDLQVNGGGGVLFNNAPRLESLEAMAAAHRRLGSTALLPTLISDTAAVREAAIEAVRAARGNPAILGIHLEGPFLESSRRGAHRAERLERLDAAALDGLIRQCGPGTVITLAPEHAAPGQIRALSEAGIRVCAGHSAATYDQVRAAVAEGLSGFTHLFNAMSPLGTRAPGMVGAALDLDQTWCGIIVDGHHVDPALVRIAHAAKPRGKLYLVSDAMATVGSTAEAFELYGERICLHEGRLVNAEGRLAGSAIGLIDAVRIATTVVGLPLEESLRMASQYPAEFIGRGSDLGRLAQGFRADLVAFDAQYRVHHTWVAGSHAAR